MIQSMVPKGSRLKVIGGIFKAVLNNPTIGSYDFTNYLVGGNRQNVAVDLGLSFNANYLYFFNQMNLSLSFEESIFLKAIAPGTVPTLSVKDSSNRKNIFSLPFRIFKYFENADVDSYHFNMNAKADMLADFQCVLNQPAELIGVSEIYAQVSFSVYEITEGRFISEYKKESGG